MKIDCAAGQPKPIQSVESEQLTNDKDNDVVVNVAAMGDFSIGVSNPSSPKTDYSEMVSHLVVNHKNVAGVENPNVFVIDEDALHALLEKVGVESKESLQIQGAAYAALNRRIQALEKQMASTTTATTTATANANAVQPATAAAGAQPGAAIVQGGLSQHLSALRSTLVAHKTAFAVVASIAVGVVVVTCSAAGFLCAMGESRTRSYEYREFNYSRGVELYRTTQTGEHFQSKGAFERELEELAARAWNAPNEYGFEPRTSPSGFDVNSAFSINGTKSNGTATLARFNWTHPTPLRDAFDGSNWVRSTFIASETVFMFACMFITYQLIVRKFN